MAQKVTAMDVRAATALAGGIENVAEFCREQNISRQTFYKWRRRFVADGLAGLEPRSRRPHTVPGRVGGDLEAQVVATRTRLQSAGLDHGPQSIVWTMQREGVDSVPSRSTVWRILHRHGLIVAEPTKRPKSSMRRFCYDRPNELWQSDWTQWHLEDGTSVAIAGTIDDHSRYLCALAADTGDATATLVWQVMLAGIAECGVPSMSLTDNGFVYTGKHHGFQTPLEKNLRALGTRTINSRPYHPQTCGKIERFWQTLKRWLNTQPPPATVDDLNAMLEQFRGHYNHTRPHRALRGATPGEVFDATERARPVDRALPAPVFTTRQTVNPKQGKITVGPYFVQVGNQWGGHTLDAICDDNHIVIFSGATIVREFDADPSRRYQGRRELPGTRGKRQPLPAA
jgi:transposase InsO family protein